MVRAASRAGVPLPGLVILETTGRRSGEPRRTPVGKAIVGDTLWVIAEHGRKAAYVPQQSRRIRGCGCGSDAPGAPVTAQVLPEDDWRERQRRIPNRVNSAAVRALGSEPVTVRVDLDPAGAPAPATPASPSG